MAFPPAIVIPPGRAGSNCGGDASLSSAFYEAAAQLNLAFEMRGQPASCARSPLRDRPTHKKTRLSPVCSPFSQRFTDHLVPGIKPTEPRAAIDYRARRSATKETCVCAFACARLSYNELGQS